MATRSVKRLLDEKREAKKILASLGALLGELAPGARTIEPSNSEDKIQKERKHGDYGQQDSPRSRG